MFRLSEALTSFSHELEERYRGGDSLSGCLTGFHDLDYQLQGLGPGEMTLLAARADMGADRLALQIAMWLAGGEKTPVLFLSLERSVEVRLRQMLQMVTGVEEHRLRTGFMSDSHWSTVREIMAQFANLPIYFVDQVGLSVSDLRGEVRVFQEVAQEGGLIIIDSLHSLGTQDRSEVPPAFVLTEVARQTKQLARDFYLPVLALLELDGNDGLSAGTRPTRESLIGSGSPERWADVLLFLHREGRPPMFENKAYNMEVIVAKTRRGERGKAVLEYTPSRGKFANLTTLPEECQPAFPEESSIQAVTLHRVRDLMGMPGRVRVTLEGVLMQSRTPRSKAGTPMYVGQLRDAQGDDIEVVAFPGMYQRYAKRLSDGEAVSITGLFVADDGLRLEVEEVLPAS